MEYEVLWSPWPDHIFIHLNHIYLNPRDRSNRHTTHNKYLTYRPVHTSRIGLNFEFDRFSLTYQKRYVSERFVTAANTVTLPAYQVDDLYFSIKFDISPLKWNIRMMLLNIFDTRYEIVRDAPLPGRHWRIGLELVY